MIRVFRDSRRLLIGLGVEAAQAGLSVLFDTECPAGSRTSDGPIDTELRIRRYKLIIVDEVGYIPLDHDAANLSFSLVASRYEAGGQPRTCSPKPVRPAGSSPSFRCSEGIS
ncbi:ATP-binding protein [Nocardia sp. NBC_00881]|uniref:ATP-binding protein n=1 Tax=Nocardia sp. NBC_00881 TaxID=2975995 RepID=UPI00386C8F02